MTDRLRCPLWLAVAAFGGIAVGQEPATDAEDGARASLARAARIMRRIDRDGNGTFEKQEDAAAWRRLRSLDTNRDQTLSIEELRRERAAYLNTAGDRKLDVVYKRTPQGDLRLDLYYPETPSDSPRPVVVYTHGGGWAAGSRRGAANGLFAQVFSKLLDRGFAVASVDYRLWRRGGEIAIRDCVIDAKDAVRYLARNGDALKLDRQRFFLMGDSAGGQIAQMLLLSSPDALPGDEDLASVPYTAVAGVSWYGPGDFEKTELFNHDDRPDFRDRFAARLMRPDADPADKLAIYREMSPVNLLSANSPPLLMIQGDRDTTIPVKHAYHMKRRAEAVGAPLEILIVKNAGHNWRKVGAEIEPSRDAIVQRTVQFFTDRLAASQKAVP
ncbi:alpha/beta hydrolase fold domain-containing protein [Alienimonas sp. DA493]|uniref:alpha/beta hydrolase fold domain-containing protein n=1 Tax=Alienimonas sp. DA493 TaxID=3373605 RepID=UPI00375493F5